MGSIKTMNLNAGHNKPNGIACGAVGLIDESKENRAVASLVLKELRKRKMIVYNCTVDDAPSQSSNLAMIVKKCEKHKVDLNVFIHFNSGVNDKTGNGKTTGTEVFVYRNDGIAKKAAEAVRSEISKLGYKDRGTKINKNLYVLSKTTAPAILIECCFVDDKDDVDLYNAEKMAKAISKALLSV